MEQLNHIDTMVQYDRCAWYVIIQILNVILYLIGNQCKSNNVDEICENLGKRVKILAAVFWIFCKRYRLLSGKPYTIELQ